jgi:hypothetical protein
VGWVLIGGGDPRVAGQEPPTYRSVGFADFIFLTRVIDGGVLGERQVVEERRQLVVSRHGLRLSAGPISLAALLARVGPVGAVDGRDKMGEAERDVHGVGVCGRGLVDLFPPDCLSPGFRARRRIQRRRQR